MTIYFCAATAIKVKRRCLCFPRADGIYRGIANSPSSKVEIRCAPVLLPLLSLASIVSACLNWRQTTRLSYDTSIRSCFRKLDYWLVIARKHKKPVAVIIEITFSLIACTASRSKSRMRKRRESCIASLSNNSNFLGDLRCRLDDSFTLARKTKDAAENVVG